MLHREDAHGLVVVTQPAHAWVSGQLARAWGNQRFGPVSPWEAVCLAAEQHDNGWAAWEANPTLNRATGRPYTFRELPRDEHVAIWSTAGRWALALGRYPALLVSLHGTGLYETYDPSPDPPETQRAVRAFLARELAFQADLLTGLRADLEQMDHVRPEAVARNRRLVAVWDAMSLALCGGLATDRVLAGVPTADGDTDLTLVPVRGEPASVTVFPWPFGRDRVTLVFEGRRLPEPYQDQDALRAALNRAPWLTFTTHLRQG